MGIKALRRIQIGLETTAGTNAAATTYWRGVGTLQDNREVTFPEEDVGYLSGVDRTYVAKLEAELEMEETEATFEQLPIVLSAGVKNVVSPATDTGGSGKIYTYTFPTTAANDIKTYSIEGGDNQQAEELSYGFVRSFSLRGAPGEAVKIGATWCGRQVATTTFTTSLSVPTVEEIFFGKAKLYIDTAGGTMGTTIKANTLLGFELAVDTGWLPVYSADGELYFGFAKSVGPEVTLNITFEHNATAVAEVAAWRAETARQIRLQVLGNALATSGSDHVYKTLRIDLVGKWESFEKLAEMDGNDVVTGLFRARYDATAAKFAEIVVVNEKASIP